MMKTWHLIAAVVVVGVAVGASVVFWDDIVGGGEEEACTDSTCSVTGEELELEGGVVPLSEPVSTPVSADTGLANPASVKCEQDDGELKILDREEGQVGYCFFTDGSVCEEWAYFRGECAQGACQKKCDAIGSRSEGWYDCNGELLYWDRCSGD
jgi:putative hemolysin